MHSAGQAGSTYAIAADPSGARGGASHRRRDRGAVRNYGHEPRPRPLRPDVEAARALRGRHRHRGPLPAADGLEDVLRLLDRRTTAPHRTPTSARSALDCPARCRRSTGGPSSTSSRPASRSRRPHPRRPAGTARTTSTRICPKGYQISQYDLPLASRGRLTFDTSDGPFTVTITRAHLEEDTAKLVHGTDAAGRKVSLVDFNRSGAPLMEIVTEPVIRTAEQARRYAEELQLLLRSIGVSDADMERGQMRVEANVSLRPRGTEPFGTRVEVKNMNSFRAVERAIAFEIERQARDARRRRAARPGDAGLVRRPRRDVPDAGQGDVRRLPLLPGARPAAAAPRCGMARVDPRGLPELPGRPARALPRRLGLSAYDAAVLVADPEATTLFEATLAADPRSSPKPVANWVTGEYLRLRNAAAGPLEVGRRELAAIIGRSRRRRSHGRRAARSSRNTSAGGGRGRDHRGARLPPDLGRGAPCDAAVDSVLAANPAAVADFRAGKAQAVGFLIGQVMKATGGQANAALVEATSANVSTRND